MFRKILLFITLLLIIIQHSSSLNNLIEPFYYCFQSTNKSRVLLDILINLLANLPYLLSNIILTIGVIIICKKRINDKLLYILVTLSYGWIGFILLLLNLLQKKIVFTDTFLKKLLSIISIALISPYFGSLIGIYTHKLIDGHYIDYVELSITTKTLLNIIFGVIVHSLTVIIISSYFKNYLKNENQKKSFWILTTLISGVIPWIIYNIIDLRKQIEENKTTANKELW